MPSGGSGMGRPRIGSLELDGVATAASDSLEPHWLLELAIQVKERRRLSLVGNGGCGLCLESVKFRLPVIIQNCSSCDYMRLIGFVCGTWY